MNSATRNASTRRCAARCAAFARSAATACSPPIPSEPNWSKAHNILMQPFGNRAMQSYHPSMVDIAEQLVKKWERLNGDEEIDVVHDMTALTLDTIGLCGFDYRFNSFYRRDYHPFVASLVRSLETIMMTRGLPLENLWMQKRRRDMAGDVAFMNKMVDEIVAERRKNAEAAEDKKDMLGAMMTGVDRATGEQLDDVNIRYQINTFLIAGPRNHQRTVVVRDLCAAETPRRAQEGL